jgi:hypothetical protein
MPVPVSMAVPARDAAPEAGSEAVPSTAGEEELMGRS